MIIKSRPVAVSSEMRVNNSFFLLWTLTRLFAKYKSKQSRTSAWHWKGCHILSYTYFRDIYLFIIVFLCWHFHWEMPGWALVFIFQAIKKKLWFLVIVRSEKNLYFLRAPCIPRTTLRCGTVKVLLFRIQSHQGSCAVSCRVAWRFPATTTWTVDASCMAWMDGLITRRIQQYALPFRFGIF